MEIQIIILILLVIKQLVTKVKLIYNEYILKKNIFIDNQCPGNYAYNDLG